MNSKVLWLLYEQGIDLTIRFDQYLEGVGYLCPLGEKDLVEYFRDQITPVRGDLADGIKNLKKFDFGKDVSDQTARGHIGTYQLAAARLQDLHFDLRFFPTQPPICPEVYVLLTDFFRSRAFREIQRTVVYFPDHNFEQINMFSLGKNNRARVVLRMPYVEFQNPLMWTNLIHEMGHALDAREGFSDRYVDVHGATLGEEDKTTRWVSEFYADQVAVQVAGPAYLCAFIAWHLTRDPRRLGTADGTHPPASERVFAMSQYIQDGLSAEGSNSLLEVFRALGPLPDSLPASQKTMAEEASASVGTDRRLRRCRGKHVRSAVGMLEELSDCTISSRRNTSNKEISRLIEKLDSPGFQSAAHFYSEIGPLQEIPNSSREILNAGWEYKLTTGLAKFYEIFSCDERKFRKEYRKFNSDFSTRYEAYRDFLTSFETRLRKSIEVAKLHELWGQAQSKIEKGRGTSTHVSTEPMGPGGVAAARTDCGALSLLSEKRILERLLRRHEDKGRIVVTPILSLRDQIQPTSIDLRLGTEFAIIKTVLFKYLDVLGDRAQADVAGYMEKIHIRPDGEFVLHPGDFALGSTLEYLILPADLAVRLEGKSTWGRMGLQIHSTAGFVDPGFQGALTFELQNVGRVPIPLYPGMRVAQICFYQCEPSSIPYSEKSDALYGGNPGLMFTQFFRLPDQDILKLIKKRFRVQK